MKIKNNNNSVLITGGTQGLGFEIANKLIENGCNEIIIAGRNEKKGTQAEQKLLKKNESIASFFVRKIFKYYYAFFWILLILYLLLKNKF